MKVEATGGIHVTWCCAVLRCATVLHHGAQWAVTAGSEIYGWAAALNHAIRGG